MGEISFNLTDRAPFELPDHPLTGRVSSVTRTDFSEICRGGSLQGGTHCHQGIFYANQAFTSYKFRKSELRRLCSLNWRRITGIQIYILVLSRKQAVVRLIVMRKLEAKRRNDVCEVSRMVFMSCLLGEPDSRSASNIASTRLDLIWN